MKYYVIYPQHPDEPPCCYVEAKDSKDLVNIMLKRNENNEPFGMFPGWFPIEISKEEMFKILNRFNEDDINLVDADKREDFNLFAKMQFNDAPIIKELNKYKLYRQKYSVNLTESEI